MVGRIFISYRRDDDPGHAGRLYDRLSKVFDRDELFMDVDSIEPGQDFFQVLEDRVAQADVLLAVIGTRWIDARDSSGIRRLESPNDFVRIEIEAALNQQKRVIPVLIGAAEMPAPEQLPESLKTLTRRHAFNIKHDRFTSDSEGLIRALIKILKDTASQSERKVVGGSKELLLPADTRSPNAHAILQQEYQQSVSTEPSTEDKGKQFDLAFSNQFASSELSDVANRTGAVSTKPQSVYKSKSAEQPVKSRFVFSLAIVIIVVLSLLALSTNWIVEKLNQSAKVAALKQNAPPPPEKLADQIGQPSSSDQIAPVAQRVVLYDEDPSEPKGKQYIGTVVWRTEQIKAAAGKPADIAVRADIDIPDRKFKMTMSFRRNTDTSLPASHTVELTFILPPNFVGGGVANVPGILMKSNEQDRGTPLAGLVVKVTDGFFLLGLSNVDTDRTRNLQLLKERSWFDVPLVYTNQRRAVIAIAKGPPGERAFNDAFAAWGG
jgi:TIR domain